MKRKLDVKEETKMDIIEGEPLKSQLIRPSMIHEDFGRVDLNKLRDAVNFLLSE